MKFLAVLLVASLAMAQADVIDTLGELGATELLRYIERAGLTGVLRGESPFTVFAPSNQAIDNLPDIVKRLLDGAPEFLAQILTFHVTPGRAYSSDLQNDLLLDTVEGSQNRINLYTKSTGVVATATGAPISTVDQEASNGVVHVIDKMILPLPRQTLVQEVVEDPDFSTLATLLQAAGLAEVLAGPGPFTLFGPTNAAFAEVPDEILEDLIQNPERLAQVLLYHVVPVTAYSAALEPGVVTTLTTVQGQTIDCTVSESGDKQVNDANAEYADLPASNGVLHIIDKVLLPEL